jgi:hyperosmotically inducible protein
MMNSNSTSKIVVGIGLAVVFGLGVAVFTVRAKHESQVAHNAPAPALAASSEQQAANPTAPAQSAAPQTPTDQAANASSAPPAAPSAVAPAVAPAPVAPTAPAAGNVAKNDVGTPPSDESKPAKSKSKASDRTDRHVAKTRNGDTTGTRVAAANSKPSPADERTATSSPAPSATDIAPAPAGVTADTQQTPAQQSPAQPGQETGASASASPAATSNEPVAADSQITASVKSEIATAAPNSNVNVTTTDGVVALAGSVSSQDAADQAKQAAQRVAGVKHVDASGLMVSNQ